MNKNKVFSTIGDIITKFIKGLFIGAISVIPFMSIENLKGMMHVNEDKYKREAHLKDIYIYQLKNKSPYLIGTLIGMILLFWVPIKDIYEMQSAAFIWFFIIIIVALLALEIYRYITIMKQEKESKDFKYYLPSIITALVALTILFVLENISVKNFEPLPDTKTMIFIVVLFFIFSFISHFSGISITSYIFIKGFYFMMAGKLYLLFSEKDTSFLLFAILLVLSYLISYIIYVYCCYFMTKRVININKEKRAFNITVYAYSFFLLLIKYLNAPFIYESKYFSETAQKYYIAAWIISAIIISIVTVINYIPFFNKEENKKEKADEN